MKTNDFGYCYFFLLNSLILAVCLMPTGSDRSYWPMHNENMAARDCWATELLAAFRRDVIAVRNMYAANNNSPSHSERSSKVTEDVQRPGVTNGHGEIVKVRQPSSKPGTAPALPRQTQLLESCLVVRLEDFALFRVTSALDNKRSTPKKFLLSDKKQLLLPSTMSSIHVEFTEYFFLEGKNFPGMPLELIIYLTSGLSVLHFFYDAGLAYSEIL